ncbi:arabinan endo-1,5-alpha-L-arabinosidase [Luteolibacter ambystomatis]|uniref:Arabinan endo-1,5-alpha-L-arabinosidase n=1 Tax=Luteolibacter ambystomatis TaxID=2824561 RepID=A0A975J254_9BACT|nr:arabinan endo-1,5-alpha-L-arabinosidase [Luteolibacter ambystomatis]QUE52648.1 arabinan endo-1,5-alpha-L-arabinosidase [Luteolibacter ambystomatis]
MPFSLPGLIMLFLLAAAPVQAMSKVHDPSTIVRCSKQAWFFSTGPGIKSFNSPDLVTWTEGPPVFKAFPAWHESFVPGNRGYLWAPDVILSKGRYCLYYSVSTFGKNTSAIGLVSTPTLDPADPRYGWKDEGVVIRSRRGDDFNAIDPAVHADNDGRLWLTFGSFWSGIQLLELDPSSGLAKKDAKPKRIAWNQQIEAPAIIHHGDFYYLFVNWGLCCKGIDSTYEIRVGRSRTIAGPYLDKDGRDLATGGGTLFLKSEGRYIGPGHFGEIVGSSRGRFSFHYYDGAAAGMSKLGVRELTWTKEDWPEAGKWIFPANPP